MKKYRITVDGTVYEVEVEEMSVLNPGGAVSGIGPADQPAAAQGASDTWNHIAPGAQASGTGSSALQANGILNAQNPTGSIYESIAVANQAGNAVQAAADNPAVQETGGLSSTIEPPGSNTTIVAAPMPGTILTVEVTAGQQVAAGDVLLILEAMKMENEILAPAAGRVLTVSAAAGASVETGDVLITME